MEFHGTASLSREESGAFWAAYKALADNGVSLAQVRADVAGRILTCLLERRHAHGMGYMLQLAQRDPEDRQHLVNQVHAGTPETYTSVTRRVVDVAMVAAARVLAEG